MLYPLYVLTEGLVLSNRNCILLQDEEGKSGEMGYNISDVL